MAAIYKSEAGRQAVEARYRELLGHWPVPSEQLRLPTCEGETLVVACGPQDAPPLLLFHGSGANTVMWMGDVAPWSQHFRVYAVDMIGEPGLSAPSRPPLDSDAYALWLDDVMAGLSLTRASIVGISLGGWLALDYATRRPARVERLALLCPAGVGRQKNFLLKAFPLLFLGAWGRKKMREMVLGRTPADLAPQMRVFSDFVSLIFASFRPRTMKLPVFSDEALKRLTMLVLAILGGKDVLLDSAGTKRRLERAVPQAEIRYLPGVGHLIRGQTEAILEFLRRPSTGRSD
jgi:pimeloyl-ACP methyl ester carboxylesterase